MKSVLRVGYARVDMTPGEPLPLAGYGNTLQRISQGVLDPLLATCIAVTDAQDKTVLLFTLDIVATREACFRAARENISRRYGVPVEAVFLCATHTHSGPDLFQAEQPSVARYAKQLVELLTQLAGQALADREDATAEAARVRNEGMNYVRHYIQANGAVCGDNFGDPTASPCVKHMSEADREIRVVNFRREGRKDILLVNWQAHPNLASTSATEHGRAHRPYITADYIGACRKYVEEKSDVHFAFFLGAAGNLNSRSRVESEVDTRDHIVYGRQLGDYVLSAMAQLKPIKTGSVGAAEEIYHGRINHTQDHLVPEAEKIRAEWVRTNDPKYCTALGVPYGIHSAYHAGAIIRKSEQPSHLDMNMGAAKIGDIGVAALPYEAFDTNGMYIREVSPFSMTLILSCANGGFNYIPSARGFAHGCYEADMCSHAPGTAEEAAEVVAKMLQRLYEEEV